MKLAKRPINPHLKHYTVRIEVTCWNDQEESEAFNRNVAATSSAQAIRKAGMSIVQNELREIPQKDPMAVEHPMVLEGKVPDRIKAKQIPRREIGGGLLRDHR